MTVMPEDCPYERLIANDLMGPLKTDLLRSSQEVVFHLHGTTITVPMLQNLQGKKLSGMMLPFLLLNSMLQDRLG
jgi:hypothetical protein